MGKMAVVRGLRLRLRSTRRDDPRRWRMVPPKCARAVERRTSPSSEALAAGAAATVTAATVAAFSTASHGAGEGDARGEARRAGRTTRAARVSNANAPLEISARAAVRTTFAATASFWTTLAPRTEAFAPSARGAVMMAAMLSERGSEARSNGEASREPSA